MQGAKDLGVKKLTCNVKKMTGCQNFDGGSEKTGIFSGYQGGGYPFETLSLRSGNLRPARGVGPQRFRFDIKKSAVALLSAHAI